MFSHGQFDRGPALVNPDRERSAPELANTVSEALILIAAPIVHWRGIFAVHAWIVLKGARSAGPALSAVHGVVPFDFLSGPFSNDWPVSARVDDSAM
jgi:hypothetical protein